MNVTLQTPDARQIGMFLAAALLGVGIGTIGQSGTVAVPAVGTVPSVVVGVVGLVAGGGTYLALERTGSGCGCSDDCGC